MHCWEINKYCDLNTINVKVKGISQKYNIMPDRCDHIPYYIT